jgi:hypothetical protein
VAVERLARDGNLAALERLARDDNLAAMARPVRDGGSALLHSTADSEDAAAAVRRPRAPATIQWLGGIGPEDTAHAILIL